MRYLIISIFGLLAANLSAHRYNGCNTRVDKTLIVDEFNNGMRSVHELPIFETGNKRANEFVELFIVAIQNLGGGVEENLYAQAWKGSEDLVRKIKKCSDELWEAVKAVEPHKEDYVLDDHLKSLTKQSNMFLNLAPGTSLANQSQLFEMPQLGTKFRYYAQQRTVNELFLHLGEIVDEDIYRTIEFMIELLRQGWSNARLSLDTTQAQHRDAFLNGRAFPVYANVAREIFEKSDLIKCHVKKETWEAFEKAGKNMIFDYEEYIKSKKYEYCEERV